MKSFIFFAILLLGLTACHSNTEAQITLEAPKGYAPAQKLTAGSWQQKADEALAVAEPENAATPPVQAPLTKKPEGVTQKIKNFIANVRAKYSHKKLAHHHHRHNHSKFLAARR